MTQPKSLRLADLLDDPTLAKYHEHKNIAAELRRLHEVNQMLVEALEAASEYTVLLDDFTQTSIQAALAKAKESNT